MSKRIDYRDLFLTKSTLEEHVMGYEHDPERYIATYMLLMNSDVHMEFTVKELVLSTLLIFKNEGCINWLFSKPFWTILDIRNVIRRLWTTKSAKTDKWLRTQMRNGRQVKASRRDILIYQIERMDSFQIERSILRHSYDAWREVIDYLHIAERSFPDYLPTVAIVEEYYEKTPLKSQYMKAHSPLMKTIMDGTWPPTPFIETMRDVNQKNAAQILEQYPMEFHYLRSKINFEKDPDIAKAYLQKCSPANIIRWYNELWFPDTEPIIRKRMLGTSENYVIHQPYSIFFDLLYMNQGMNRDLFDNLVNRADKMTSRFNLPYHKPALIAVDQSSSMSAEQVKIGTVIANLIGHQLDADLVYFHGGGWSRSALDRGWQGNQYSKDGAVALYEDVPLGTRGAIKLVDHHPPSGNTPIAQILARYMTATGYLVQDSKQLKTIVLVTDEGENGHWNHMYFAEALSKYRNLLGERIEVLVIAIQSDDITVTNQLKSRGFDVIRYRIDTVRHVESLFAMIAANTPAFLFDAQKLAQDIKGRLLSSIVLDKGEAMAYQESEDNLKRYQRSRDIIFASVIKGTCANCGANLEIKNVNRFRFGETIECQACNFSLAPTLFGATRAP